MDPELATKITGMLLEMPQDDIVTILCSNDKVRSTHSTQHPPANVHPRYRAFAAQLIGQITEAQTVLASANLPPTASARLNLLTGGDCVLAALPRRTKECDQPGIERVWPARELDPRAASGAPVPALHRTASRTARWPLKR